MVTLRCGGFDMVLDAMMDTLVWVVIAAFCIGLPILAGLGMVVIKGGGMDCASHPQHVNRFTPQS